ncbi:hypothetical protein WMW72_24850 [Paenibacillus filicis]|uniref:Uncharacterized protein n=1 Tax=Paenibacillus filicis TaxID=669464 RepID=A0ABU9DQI4_9BACL
MKQVEFSRNKSHQAQQPGDIRSRSRMQARADGASYAVYLYIWGLAWMLSAACLFLQQFRVLPVSSALFTVVALAASALVWYRQSAGSRSDRGRRAPAEGQEPARVSKHWSLAALYTAAGVFLLLLLTRLGALEPLDWYIGKGLLLAVVYGGLSRTLGKPVALLAVWQLALTAIVGWKYLGFGPVWLDGFSGAGLLVLAGMLQLWNRGEVRT